MRRNIFTIAFLVLCPVLIAQQALKNDDIIKMTKAGLSDGVIIATINSSAGTYDTSADGLIALKTAGASDKVISAVVLKAAGATNSPSVSSASQPGNNAQPASADSTTAPSSGALAPPAQETPSEGSSSGTKPVAPGSRVVIAPMGGFETYFAAAVREKRVPITLTLDKASAQYFVVSTNTEWQGFVYGAGGGASVGPAGGTAGWGAHASSTRGLEASIMLIDARSKDVIWAYEVHKNSHGALIFGTFGARGQQSIAEACAKHLKEYVEKGK